MIKHKSIGIITAMLMALSLLFLSVGYANPAMLEGVTGSAALPYAAAMDKGKILDIQIVAEEKDWETMLKNATTEEYIPATVIINGVKIKNVGIRPKGNSSLSMVARDSTTDRYSFKIEFDHYVTGQTWLGLDKIVVNNMQGDSTYMKEYLSYDLMAYVGVDTPLYTFSSISVNGEEWGFYLAVEALEDSYAKRVYGNDHGKLYKPESMGVRGNGQMNEFIEGNADRQQSPPEGDILPRDRGGMQFPADGQGDAPTFWQVTGNNAPNSTPNTTPNSAQGGFGRGVEIGGGMGGMNGGSGGANLQYTNDEISSYSVIFEGAVFDISDSDRKSLISALKNLNTGEDLENAVDVAATLKYFAAHTVIVNLDSYVSNMCHNYYLYEKNGQLTMLPWDFNLAFGGFQSSSASSVVNFPIDTPVSGVSLAERPILAKLLEAPEYLELYHAYLRDIVDGYFNNGAFEQTIDSLNALISPHVENDPSAFYNFTAYQNGVAELKKLGLLRAQSIEGQLNGDIPSTTAGQSANPSLLLDATGINMSALGSMGGGGFAAMPANIQGGNRTDGMQNFNTEDMQRVLEIIGVVGDGDFTEEQLAELRALGISETQISMLRSMVQGGRGGNMQNGMNRQTGTQIPANPQNQQNPLTSGFGREAWLLLGVCTLSLFGGLLFVVFFKRRKPSKP